MSTNTKLGQKESVLQALGIKEFNQGASTGLKWISTSGDLQEITSPADGKSIGSVTFASVNDYKTVMDACVPAFKHWKTVPAPKRGEIVRQIGEALRTHKENLGWLVSYEMGKIYQEGLGEVQEMIDICDFAVGLSRQLHGFTMHSERPSHRMYDQYHPLGTVGIISAFNFPVAVWAWNAMLAAVCGDVCIWKPSEKTPMTAIAVQNIISTVLKENEMPEGIFNLVIGDREVGKAMAADTRMPLLSATGSIPMGKDVAKTVGARLGRSLLELGGNNAIIITPEADLKMCLTGVVFGSVGTCGQRCTSTRRLIIHESIYNKFKESLVEAYKHLKIGNPLHDDTLVGPLIDKDSVNAFVNSQKKVVEAGGKILCGGEVLEGPGYESGCYVKPCLAEVENHWDIVQHETFGPLLYLMKYKTLDEAIEIQNSVPQGLSSSIFTKNMMESETFLSAWGSDCGIANVNIGTSGAEIGGAFGGEKETGGGRESGSDAWKAYMRRQTNTINYSPELPLAQGIKFDI
ncbi:MAG: aldehyde dehydrogenase (NAD+) [Sphingobacteriales bacterium]|jgi:aldehyde dehydrogenase (NAD+)